jgi:4'-phosphopantetheinyl transferase
VLLNELINSPLNIRYHSDGRPYLEDSPTHISISHSSGYIAIILHENYFPGIDIELITRKVGKVAKRFLSPSELTVCNSNQEMANHRMLLHWCAKEAIFKMIPLSDIEFSTDISILIDEFVETAESFQGTFNSKSGAVPITLYHKVIGELLIVWGWVEKTRFEL